MRASLFLILLAPASLFGQNTEDILKRVLDLSKECRLEGCAYFEKNGSQRPLRIEFAPKQAGPARYWRSDGTSLDHLRLNVNPDFKFIQPAVALSEIEGARILDQAGLSDQESFNGLEELRFWVELAALRRLIDQSGKTLSNPDFNLSGAEAAYLSERFGFELIRDPSAPSAKKSSFSKNHSLGVEITKASILADQRVEAKNMGLFLTHFEITRARLAAAGFNGPKMNFHLNQAREVNKNYGLGFDIEVIAAPLEAKIAPFKAAKEGLQDPSIEIRLNSIRSLKVLAIKEKSALAIEALTSALGDKEREVMSSAVLALHAVHNAGVNVIPALIESGQNFEISINTKGAALALARIGLPALEPCIEALNHQNAFTKVTVIDALGYMGAGAKKALPALQKLMRTDDGIVGSRAASAYSTIVYARE